MTEGLALLKDFRFCLQAGDADTNGAIAGALLGCKLGLQALDVKRQESGWLTGLVHKQWLDDIVEK